MNIREKSPSCFQQGERKSNHFEIHQNTLSFSTKPALRKRNFDQNLSYLGQDQSLTNLGKGKYVTPACTGHPVPPDGEGMVREELVKFTAQGRSLTKRLRPNQRTVKRFPFSHTLPANYSTPIYHGSFHPEHHVWFSTKKNHKAYQKAKHTEKTKSKHPNQMKMWQGCGIFRPGIQNNYD